MRRFFARPSGVSFDSRGRLSANETAARRSFVMPFSSNSRTMREARAPPSSQFVGYFAASPGPIFWLSVCPVTAIWNGDALSCSDTFTSRSLPVLSSSAEPDLNRMSCARFTLMPSRSCCTSTLPLESSPFRLPTSDSYVDFISSFDFCVSSSFEPSCSAWAFMSLTWVSSAVFSVVISSLSLFAVARSAAHCLFFAASASKFFCRSAYLDLDTPQLAASSDSAPNRMTADMRANPNFAFMAPPVLEPTSRARASLARIHAGTPDRHPRGTPPTRR